MSQRQALAIVQALLEDETLGLRAKTEALASSLPNAPTGNPGPLSADFAFYRGALPGALRPTTRGNVMLRPVRWITNPRIGQDAGSGGVREGTAPIEIGFETFGASHEDNVDEATLVATALVQCLDGIREFADANKTRFGACVVGIAPGMDFSFGDFEGPASYGFLARITVEEESQDD
jgi:hypothetical protein